MTNENKYPKIDAALAALNLVYEATFVPLSQSRNKDWESEKSEHKSPTINWKIRIGRTSRLQHPNPIWIIETDWSAGIAHVPGYQFTIGGENGWKRKYYECVCEQGKYFKALPKFSGEQAGKVDWYEAHERIKSGSWSVQKSHPLPKPEFRDVFYSLLSDADVLDHDGFEDWASNFGYDPDSRKAEKIYKDCLELGLKMRNMLGDGKITELRDIYQEEGF